MHFDHIYDPIYIHTWAIAASDPVKVHILTGWPPLSGAICILQPESCWSRVICSPPLPMIMPTILSGTVI